MSDQPPRIENAPGLKWTNRKTGWEARWRARIDLVGRGYQTRSVPLWRGKTLDEAPDDGAARYIRSMCERLQAEMLVWSRGGIQQIGAPFDGTIRTLIQCYQTDPDSNYHKLRFQSRKNTDYRCKCLDRDHGGDEIANIKARTLLRWHEQWSAGGKIATGHTMVAIVRTLVGFGATFLEDDECIRLRGVLAGMKFKMGKRREEMLTAGQAMAVRDTAHKIGLHSLARAQAFQFEGTLRQKDIIGEWVPVSEPGVSDVTDGNEKWLWGIRWSEIDQNMILRHVTSKREKEVVVDLRLAPMVLEELAKAYPGFAEKPDRSLLPPSGPIIVYERTGLPYVGYQFRLEWRRTARAAGIPDKVWNMDSRAGAISEGISSGASLETVRHAATHSNITTTQGYDRAAAEATAEVMRSRVEHRNKK